MHAVYDFLIEVPDTLLEAGDGLAAAAAHLEEAYYSRMDRRLDDDSQPRLLAAIFDDGRIAVFPENAGAKLSAHERASLILKRRRAGHLTPDARRWEQALDHAMQRVAVDLRLYGASPISFGPERKDIREKLAAGRAKLLADIEAEIAPALDAAVKAGAPLPPFNGREDAEAFMRLRDARTLQALRRSAVKPFTLLRRTPYEYRAFDLRANRRRKKARLAVLQVDIHT